ncbi:MAG TPA: DinB family protein [Vicinamibacteria bacterium]|jgi:hypothetical protein|nr:DinB family protein [Vicinamibacteria bacterium]
MLRETTLVRLAAQLEALPSILGESRPSLLAWRPPTGKWSAHENLAHLARHHEILQERLGRILGEERPQLARYRAEEDPDWPRWSALPTDEVLSRLRGLRGEILGRIRELPPARLERVGVHPLFGEMTIPGWLEFFLLHEAHHLYVVMIRLGEARKALVGDA